MDSNDTKRIIKKLAEEFNMSEWAIELIVKSQFEGVNRTMASGIHDKPETFKGIFLNAFGTFKVMYSHFARFKGREEYEKEKRRRYDNKKQQRDLRNRK